MSFLSLELDIDRDWGYRSGGGLGWDYEEHNTSGWGDASGMPTAAEWSGDAAKWEAEWGQGGRAAWEACAPLIKVEEEEPVLEWPEDRESVLRVTRETTPYPSPPLSKSFPPFLF
jgi:hypothetical protein